MERTTVGVDGLCIGGKGGEGFESGRYGFGMMGGGGGLGY